MQPPEDQLATPPGGPTWASAPPVPPATPAPSGALAIVAAVLAGVWMVLVVVLSQTIVWFWEQLDVLSGVPLPAWRWPLAAWLAAIVAGLPALLLALIPRSPALRATGNAWTCGAVALGVLGSVRAVPVLANEAYLALLALAAVVLGVALLALANRARSAPE